MDIQASWVHATVAVRNHSSYSPSIDVAAASSFFTRPTGSQSVAHETVFSILDALVL